MTGFSTISRRSLLRTAAIGAGALAFPSILRAQSAPIQIGVFFQMSGGQAPYGQAFLQGAQFAADAINESGGLLGRQIEFALADDKGDPTESVAISRDMLGRGIGLLAGGHSTGGALAVMGSLPEKGAAFMVVGANGTAINHENYIPSMFRSYPNAYALYVGQGKIMAEKYPEITKWAAILPDAAFAYSAWAAFQLGLNEGRKAASLPEAAFTQPEIVKFGAADYRLQAGNLMANDAEGLFCGIAGADGVTFYSQISAFGFADKYKALADVGTELALGKALKQNLPNLWSPMAWYHGAEPQTAAGKALYDRYVATTQDTMPTGLIAKGHVAIASFAAAIEKAQSTDPEDVKAALSGLTVETAFGPGTYRPEDHQIVADIGYAHLGPKSDAPEGWGILDFAAVDGKAAADPATPGQSLGF